MKAKTKSEKSNVAKQRGPAKAGKFHYHLCGDHKWACGIKACNLSNHARCAQKIGLPSCMKDVNAARKAHNLKPL